MPRIAYKVEREYKFHPTRKWKFDYAWPEAKLALEIEGGGWVYGGHNRGKGFMDNMDKYNEAVILGWRVLRCTPQQYKNGEAATLINRALGVIS